MKRTEETRTAEQIALVDWDFPTKDSSYAQIETANIIVMRRQQAQMLAVLERIDTSLHLISNQLIELERAGVLPVIREQRQQARLIRKNRLLQQKASRVMRKKKPADLGVTL